MTAPSLTLLDYASVPSAEPWRVLPFRPSKRSKVLLVLTALAMLWLCLRHQPWREVGVIPDLEGGMSFTSDGRILGFGSKHGANLYDPSTAKLIRNVLPQLDLNVYRYFPLEGGEKILALPFVDRVAMTYSVESGRVVGRLANPDRLGSRLVAVAPDAPRLITARTEAMKHGLGDHFRGWDLKTSANDDAVELDNELRIGSTEFSADGKRLLNVGRYAFTGTLPGFELFDGVTFKLISRHVIASPGYLVSAGFAEGQRVWLVRVEWAKGNATSKLILETLSSETGKNLSTVSLSSNSGAIRPIRSVIVSEDLRWVALEHPGPMGEPMLDLLDAQTGMIQLRRTSSFTVPIQFLAGSDRLVTRQMNRDGLAIVDGAHEQPLAVIPGITGELFAPDGRTILCPVGGSAYAMSVWRQTGWQCPESHLGALVFPATWLVSVAFVALIFSLWRDARAARLTTQWRRAPDALDIGLLAVSGALTLHLLISACVGHSFWTPAPLLLTGAIGLAAQSRFWRLGTLLLLTGCLPLCLYLGWHLQRLGWQSSSSYAVLDRVYEIPHTAALVALAIAVPLIVVALPVLARRPADLP